jgi:hypothetical protein
MVSEIVTDVSIQKPLQRPALSTAAVVDCLHIHRYCKHLFYNDG